MVNRVKLGIFIVLGAILLTFLIFKIGTQDLIFQNKGEVVAIFENTKGLKEGNDVRYSGVPVGTVKKIDIINDTAVRVIMSVESEAARYIKQDSKAKINSEGLVGSKYIAISSGTPEARGIEDGERILTEKSVDIDEMVTSITQTSNNAQKLTENLNQISENIADGEGTLGALVTDDKLYNNTVSMVNTIEQTGEKTNQLADKMMEVPQDIKQVTNKIGNVTDTFQIAGGHAIEASENIVRFSEKLNNEESTLGKLLTDTTMANEVDETITEVQNTAQDLQYTSCQVRNSFFVRLFGKNDK